MINRKDYQISDLNDNLSLAKLVGSRIVDIDCWVTLDPDHEGDLFIVPNAIIFENGVVLHIGDGIPGDGSSGLINATDHEIPGVIFDQEALLQLRNQDPDFDLTEWDNSDG